MITLSRELVFWMVVLASTVVLTAKDDGNASSGHRTSDGRLWGGDPIAPIAAPFAMPELARSWTVPLPCLRRTPCQSLEIASENLSPHQP